MAAPSSSEEPLPGYRGLECRSDAYALKYLKCFLQPGEQLLWAQRGHSRRIFARNFLSAAFWSIVIWICSGLMPALWRDNNMLGLLIDVVVVASAILGGGDHFRRALESKTHIYGLTSQRALVSIGGRAPRSFLSRDFEKVAVDGGKDGEYGSIRFCAYEDADGRTIYKEGFYEILDPR